MSAIPSQYNLKPSEIKAARLAAQRTTSISPELSVDPSMPMHYNLDAAATGAADPIEISSTLGSPSSLMSGYLHKRRSGWLQRYYVLEGPFLEGWHDEHASLHSKAKRLDLRNCTIVSLSPSQQSRPFCFAIVTNAGKQFVLSAKSETERSSWIKSMRQAMKLKPSSTDTSQNAAAATVHAVPSSDSLLPPAPAQSHASSFSSMSQSSISHSSNTAASSGKETHFTLSGAESINKSVEDSPIYPPKLSPNSAASFSATCSSCSSTLRQPTPITCATCHQSVCESCASHHDSENKPQCRDCFEQHQAHAVPELDNQAEDSMPRSAFNPSMHHDVTTQPSPTNTPAISISIPPNSMASLPVFRMQPSSIESTTSVVASPAPASTATTTSKSLSPATMVQARAISSPATTRFLSNPAVEATRDLISPVPIGARAPPSTPAQAVDSMNGSDSNSRSIDRSQSHSDHDPTRATQGDTPPLNGEALSAAAASSALAAPVSSSALPSSSPSTIPQLFPLAGSVHPVSTIEEENVVSSTPLNRRNSVSSLRVKVPEDHTQPIKILAPEERERLREFERQEAEARALAERSFQQQQQKMIANRTAAKQQKPWWSIFVCGSSTSDA